MLAAGGVRLLTAAPDESVGLVGAVTRQGVSASASATPATTVAGASTTLTARVRSTTARTVVVDVEVYRSTGERVFQKSWTGQALAAKRRLYLRTPWQVPATPGEYRVAVGVFTPGWAHLLVWSNQAATVTVTPGSSTTPSPTAPVATTPPPVSTTPVPPSPSTQPAPPSTAPTASPGPAAPDHFSTLGTGATLPSAAQCASWVRSAPVPAEVKGINAVPGATPGAAMAGATGLNARVDGAFTGTTEQILRWAACKWGIDEDVVKAQAAVESWWRMDTRGDWGTDASRCAPGHGLGADGTAGQCPESFGLLQIRYPYNQAAFPYAITSSAFNADYAYAQWRNCYLGNLTWLNTVDRGSDYAAGDAWGCLGVWFSGRWHTTAANDYVTKVKGYLDQRIWTTPNFKQP